jgi:hypothetical protein
VKDLLKLTNARLAKIAVPADQMEADD